MTARLAENDSEIFIDGPHYTWVLQCVHAYKKPRNYFEIGVQFGDTLKLSQTRSLGVDPAFHLGDLVLDPERFTLREMTSDTYFARHRVQDDLRGAVEFAFLDGMHEFPFLLRDFINTEKAVAPDAIVAMHDCLPRDAHMTRLWRDIEVQRPTNYPNHWTGDVWKMIPVLRKYRPDLDVRCLDAPPTGLTVVRNLDPSNTVLADAYEEILRDWQDLALEDYGVARLFDVARVDQAAEWIEALASGTSTEAGAPAGPLRLLARRLQLRRRLQGIKAAFGA